MSDTTVTENEIVTETTPVAKAKVERVNKSARPSLKLEAIQALATSLGLEPREKKSFVHYGYKGGVQVSVARNEDVTRVYFYGSSLSASLDGAFVNYTEQERKELALGGVTQEVDFAKGADAALAAITTALNAALAAPAPAPKAVAKPKKPKTVSVDESSDDSSDGDNVPSTIETLVDSGPVETEASA